MSLWSRVKAAFTRKPTPCPSPAIPVGVPHPRQTGKSMLAAKMQAAQQLIVPDPPYRRTTNSLRRFRRDADRRYLHVSVPMTRQIVDMVALFGDRWFRRVHKGKGITYRKENN